MTLQFNRKWLVYILFSVWSLVYLRYIIDLSLFPLLQYPAFFTHFHFFKTFLTYPGGIVTYCARFLTVLCNLAWLSTFVTAILLLMIILLTETFLKIVGIKKVFPAIALIPAIMFLGLHGNYGHRFVYDIDLLLTLTLYILYRLHLQKNIPMQIIFQSCISGLLLYIGGIIPFGLFMLMVLIDEVKDCKGLKQSSPILLTIMLTILLPYLYYDYLFIGCISSDWGLINELLHFYKVPYIPLFPFLFYPFISATFPLFIAFKEKHSTKSPKHEINKSKIFSFLTPGSFIVQGLLITFFIFLSHLLFHDVNVKMLGKMQKFSDQKKWDKVILTADKCYPYDNLVYLMRNRALYHTGKLLDHLFDYPQLYGVDGLMYEGNAQVREYIAYSDIAYDMAEVNQALRWSYEMIANSGHSAFALKRIALVNMVTGNYVTVKKTLKMLEYVPFQKKWVAYHRTLINNHELLKSNKEILEKRSLLPEKLYFSSDEIPYMSFLVNLFFNKKNRMAYEYLIATLLLDNDLDECIKYVKFLNFFGYRKVSRHLQEALLIYGYSKGQPDKYIKQFNISRETVERFKNYKEEVHQCRGNGKKAEAALRRRFGTTFWYYQQFIYPHRKLKKTSHTHIKKKY